MKIQLVCVVVLSIAVSAVFGAETETNQTSVATGEIISALINDYRQSPIAKTVPRSGWDKTDFFSVFQPGGNEVSDVFIFKWLSSRTGRVSFGPIITSTYACSASPVIRDYYFGGLFLQFALR